MLNLYFYIHVIVISLATVNIILVAVWTKTYLGGFASNRDPLHHFNYHPLLSVVGLIILYGEGLLLFRTLPHKTKPLLKLLHSIVMFIIFIISVISLNCVFDSHNKRKVPIPNLYSLHSWIGLGTVVLFSFQFACGFLCFWYPRFHTVCRRALLPYHRFLGLTIFILSVLSCHSGIMEKVKSSLKEKYLELPPAGIVANLLGVTITLYAILVVYLASMPDFRRIPLPEENKLQLNEMHTIA